MMRSSLVFVTGLLTGALSCLPAAGAERGEGGERPWRAVVAPAGEPGERLRVTGRVFAADGETPLAGVEVYVYQTDLTGHYSAGGQDRENARLRGTLWTDAEGRYELDTVKPGHYPGGRVPAHIHYVLTLPDGTRERHGLHFAGDPALSARAAAARTGRFGDIRPLEKDASGTLHCVRDIRTRFGG